MQTYALPYCPSNMENAEFFRLYGTLPSERILQLLDDESASIEAAARISEHVQAAHDGLPCEDFADDLIWKLKSLREDETTINDAAAAQLQIIITELTQLQADLYTRAEAAAQSLRCIEDELSAWARS
jgi:hypothetical protein